MTDVLQPGGGGEAQGASPADDTPISHNQLKQAVDQMSALAKTFALTPEHREEIRRLAEQEALDAVRSGVKAASGPHVSPRPKRWMLLKWTGGMLITGAVAIFGFGTAYQKAIGDNATKSHVEAEIRHHREVDFIPLQTEIQEFKKEMEPVQRGVKVLVDDRNKERSVKKVKRTLERHDKDYQEALQEYTADKAAGRSTGPRPRKTQVHIDLEQTVSDMEDKL